MEWLEGLLVLVPLFSQELFVRENFQCEIGLRGSKIDTEKVDRNSSYPAVRVSVCGRHAIGWSRSEGEGGFRSHYKSFYKEKQYGGHRGEGV